MALVVVSGATIPVQIAVNKRLYETFRSPTVAVCATLLIGFTIATAVTLLVPAARGELSAAPRAPWWAWLGGLFIAFAITVQVLNAKHEGAGPIIALVVAGQLTAALVLDHLGALGMDREPIKWWKVVGTVAMAGGAALMQIKGK
jgi:transporter family-2 protein